MSDKSILAEPAKHSLPDVLRALKFGRPADEQRFLLRIADILEKHGCSPQLLDEIEGELRDPADWWKDE